MKLSSAIWPGGTLGGDQDPSARPHAVRGSGATALIAWPHRFTKVCWKRPLMLRRACCAVNYLVEELVADVTRR